MSTNRVMEIIKQKYHPEAYAAEKAQKEKEIAEMLAFVDGVLAGMDRESERQEEVKKAGIKFISDPTDPKGFKPNKQS